jgi:2-polyprenyl-6-methoxyphenol hydroxylase-like FAD-dependent oxidoreductase
VREDLFPGHVFRAGRVKELVCQVHVPALATEIGAAFIKTFHPDGGLAFGIVPCGAGRLIWFLQYDSERWTLEREDAALYREFTLARMAGWPEPIPAILEATEFADVHLWHTADLDPLPGLHRGNVALVGDAAHVMLPFTSQGANSALEDAVELAACLSVALHTGGRPLHALASFDAIRRPVLRRYLKAGRELAAAFLRPAAPDGKMPLPLVME